MNKNKNMDRMKELIQILQEASKVYYAQDREIMSNYDYDKYYDELMALEETCGIVMADSPTVKVGYEAVNELPKERHEKQMLSLGKTKDREELKAWLGNQKGILSWKMDGLTIVLTYRNGKLMKAVTRGNGEIGEVVTNNAFKFKNLPLSIPFQNEVILRGEAVITYSDFNKINENIADIEEKYKNPRNLCSGSVRQLNNEITAARNVRFYAFSLVKAEEMDFHNSRKIQMDFLSGLGFEVAGAVEVDQTSILDVIEEFSERIQTYDIPTDGLVLCYDDIAYGESLGSTSKFPRDSIAFKWADETRETVLREIEWSPSRTGLINPVAIFEPVELEGTTVSRASVHNLSILKNLQLGIGDVITVYKANMIIPQIAENLTRSNQIQISEKCPVCGSETVIVKENEAEVLICPNPSCDIKKLKSFSHFVSRDAMNVDGLSEATLEKFIGKGFIHTFADLYHLNRFQSEIITMEGFGEKSYQNLIASIETSRRTNLARVIYALGIANIGPANAKMLSRFFKQNMDAVRRSDLETLSSISGIGEVIALAIVQYFENEKNKTALDLLLAELNIEKEEQSVGTVLDQMTFVITGSLETFENRKELQTVIENLGGKVTGSVTAKTSYLINNDTQSSSSKNKKAKELSVPIISEQEFKDRFLS
ncbi:MAG: NAD-dependent DNA ligase LigA [Lachnospiraceae bacterium]|nr:NAD-dependent DNA ligase LigA [Lachnospiraceae bacterium]